MGGSSIPCDRKLVYDTLYRWDEFGGEKTQEIAGANIDIKLELFDNEVRTQLGWVVHSACRFPYTWKLIMVAPWMWFELDMASSVVRGMLDRGHPQAAEHVLRYLFCTILQMFVGVPLTVDALLIISLWAHHNFGHFELCVSHVLVTVLVTSLWSVLLVLAVVLRRVVAAVDNPVWQILYTMAWLFVACVCWSQRFREPLQAFLESLCRKCISAREERRLSTQ